IYVGHVGNFTITNSYLHDDVIGHELKSRAYNNDIENNRIFDNSGNASYSIDLPEGYSGLIRNNIIQQGPNSDNTIIISYGEESPSTGQQLSVTGNTILNEMAPLGYGLKNATAVTASVTNNTIFGLSADRVAIGPNTQSNNTTLTTEPALDTSHPW